MKNPFEGPSGRQEAEPYVPLRRGGPEEAARKEEELEKSLKQARAEDVEGNERNRAEWPEKKRKLEKQKQDIVAKIEKAKQKIEDYKEEWRINNDRAFARQVTRNPAPKQGEEPSFEYREEIQALNELRGLRDRAKSNMELYEEEKRKLEIELSELGGEISLGDASFGGGA